MADLGGVELRVDVPGGAGQLGQRAIAVSGRGGTQGLRHRRRKTHVDHAARGIVVLREEIVHGPAVALGQVRVHLGHLGLADEAGEGGDGHRGQDADDGHGHHHLGQGEASACGPRASQTNHGPASSGAPAGRCPGLVSPVEDASTRTGRDAGIDRLARLGYSWG